MAASGGYWKGGSFQAMPDRYSKEYMGFVSARSEAQKGRHIADAERYRRNAIKRDSALKGQIEELRSQGASMEFGSYARAEVSNKIRALEEKRKAAVDSVAYADKRLRMLRR